MEPVQFANILVAPDRLAELDGTRVVASISRENFRGGEIVVTRVCKRPYLLSLIAAALIVVGAYTARSVIVWLRYGGTHSMAAIMMVLLIPGGIWLLWEAWRRAPMLVLRTTGGTVHLEFKGPATEQGLAGLRSAALERGFDLQHRA